ncbi:hypothetical protein CAEBREN_12470 [Caenorhabditis brenneri]|uniref:Uncharacterized protein n=1 Tax=Caenorhabditis brenneri TaxID=135651 RepID=G0NYT1_CAEBE|nr:hypothetical protein CAEBREN_12470 [Caenorhabditis brenneri]
MNFTWGTPSLFKATTRDTQTRLTPKVRELMNMKNQTIAVKPNSLKLKRYADLFKTDKQEAISVPEQALPESVNQNSLDTISATVEHDPVIGDSTDNVEIPSPDNLKLGSSKLAYEKQWKLSRKEEEDVRFGLFQTRLIATLIKHIETAKKICIFDQDSTIHTAKPTRSELAQEFGEPAPKRFKAAN